MEFEIKSLIIVICASGSSCVAFKPHTARCQFHPALTSSTDVICETAHCDRYHHMLTNTQTYPGLNLGKTCLKQSDKKFNSRIKKVFMQCYSLHIVVGVVPASIICYKYADAGGRPLVQSPIMYMLYHKRRGSGGETAVISSSCTQMFTE